MPGEVLDRPNPQPAASGLPDEVLSLSVKLNYVELSDSDRKAIEQFRRGSDYMAAGMELYQFSVAFNGLLCEH